MNEELMSMSRLAFVQGKYDESLKLAKKALAEDEKTQMHTSAPEMHICPKQKMLLTARILRGVSQRDLVEDVMQ